MNTDYDMEIKEQYTVEELCKRVNQLTKIADELIDDVLVLSENLNTLTDHFNESVQVEEQAHKVMFKMIGRLNDDYMARYFVQEKGIDMKMAKLLVQSLRKNAGEVCKAILNNEEGFEIDLNKFVDSEEDYMKPLENKEEEN